LTDADAVNKILRSKCENILILLAKLLIMASKNDAPGMKGDRSRNENGQLRDKRDDTHMGTIEKQYDRDFGVRSDKELGNFLKENNIASLNDLIHSDLGKK
jgi:hypothetical protein